MQRAEGLGDDPDDLRSKSDADDLLWSDELESSYCLHRKFETEIVDPERALKSYSRVGFHKRGFSVSRITDDRDVSRRRLEELLFRDDVFPIIFELELLRHVFNTMTIEQKHELETQSAHKGHAMLIDTTYPMLVSEPYAAFG